MGISGLLQFLKEASEPTHVSQYKGQTLAVDTYCWLHKGAFACAEKLARGEPTDQYVAYCMKFAHMLQSQGVRPILVFDGCTLPSKKDVERARREKRQANLQKGKQLLREGKLSEARECFTRSVNITSDMAHQVIKAARSEGIECIVAPYEADSQLAYLNKNGFAQAVITEDSDLLAFGCKKVILKMDQYGNGLEIDQARFGKCKHLGDVFTEEKFRYMCILSGCDYLPSIHGVGLAKASKVLKIANNPDIIQVIKKMGQYLKSNITVPDGYTDGFIRANNTFLYQLVFDPVKRKLVPLNPYEDGIDPQELSYAGPNVGDAVGYQIALGNIDVNTMKKIDRFDPDDHQITKLKSHSWNNKISDSGSIWQGNFTSCANIKSEEKPKVEAKTSRRGLIIPSNKHTTKRPLEGRVSESDLLSQYSFSQNKKPKKESEDPLTKLKASPASNVLQPLEDGVNTTDVQPKARNKFATLLQRRNEQSGSVAVTGTRSRFFCSQSDLVASSSIDVLKPTDHTTTNSPRTPDEAMEKREEIPKLCKRELTPSPASDDSGVKSNADSPLRNPRNCFSWSGSLTKGNPKPETPSSSILSLRRFQRTKSSMESGAGELQMDHTAHFNEEPPKCATESEKSLGMEDSSSEDMDTSLQSSPEFSLKESPVHQTAYPERKPIPKTKVPGLPKSKSFDSRSGAKLKPLAPARASGLSSRAPARCVRNNENTPGVQATISGLWRSFSYKKY